MDMTKREYAEEIAKVIGGMASEAKKPNGIVRMGVTKRIKDTNISPTVYIDEMYVEGLSVKQAAKQVLEVIDKNQNKQSFDVSFIYAFEDVKPKLRAALYNAKSDFSPKRDASVYGFDGLIVTAYIKLNDTGTIKVNDGMLELWKVTADEVIDAALENSKADCEITNMNEIMIEMIMESKGYPREQAEALVGMMSDAISSEMYVISTKRRQLGAINAITNQDKLKEMFPDGYIILPSSVHEVIAIPVREDTPVLDDMVNQVNASNVEPEEVLGDRAYVFNN